MGKKIYVGVNGAARKVKRVYFGVNGAARRVKKAYIGIGGVARPCFSGNEVTHYGAITPLQLGRRGITGASNPGYAMFAGGNSNTMYVSADEEVDAYSAALTRVTASTLDFGLINMGGTHVGDYAVFAGGSMVQYGDYVDSNYVFCFNSALTKTKVALSIYPSEGAAAVGGYAILTSGTSGSAGNDARALNASLTEIQISNLSPHRNGAAGASVGNYALIAGGFDVYNYISYDNVDAYDASLTRSIPAAILVKANSAAGISIPGYALIAGGTSKTDRDNPGVSVNTVTAYNPSLTRTAPSVLSAVMYSPAGAALKSFAVFVGDSYVSPPPVDTYDEALTRGSAPALSVSRSVTTGASIGNYALIAGGTGTGNYSSNVVDAYTVL